MRAARDRHARPGGTHAADFPGNVGIGHCSMDQRRRTRGNSGRYGATLPFQIPLSALLPKRTENLLPACKNLGVTHLINGCYRLHPIEWNIGESVASLVAFCVARRAQETLRREYLRELEREGIPLRWPQELPR